MMVEARITVGPDEIVDLEEALRYMRVRQEERRRAESEVKVESAKVNPEPAQNDVIVKAMEAPGPETKPEPDPTTEPITKERLQALFRAFAPTHVERAKSLLNQFGINRLGELPEPRYGEFAAALQ